MFRVQNRCLQHVVRRHKTTQGQSIADETASYQYLQRSKTPMLHFQPSLPRLAIPALDKTCDRYLAALRPLLPEATYQNTKAIVDKFRTNDGPKLNKLLIAADKANKHTSYISAPWFEMYLKDRKPLPVNYNVSLTMKPDERAAYNDQLIRTTNLVISTLRFMRSLRENLLRPEVYHMNPKKTDTVRYENITRLAPSLVSTYVSYAFNAFPLDMSQYQGLFGATRIPEFGQDRIVRTDKSRHFVCIKDGHFYAVDALDKHGNIEEPKILLARLKYVLTQKSLTAEYPVGLLTTENRDTWAILREHLSTHGNAEALEKIDSALFCVCFHDVILDEERPVPMIKDALAGDGINRWFDKSISLFVSKDGTASVSFEHSWGDGVAVLRYFNEIYSDSINSPFIHPDTLPLELNDIDHVVRPIQFQLDDKAKAGIDAARKNHNKVMNSLAMDFVLYQGMNKSICKQYGLSPDSIMQLGFQLAYLKQNGKYCATYESCSTAAFRHGRTETIRPCTRATKEFCDAISSLRNRPSNAALRTMIDKCSKVHGNLTKEAAMGQGFDRHLYGLKHMANVHNEKLPKLYKDEGYAVINHNQMSTSTLSSPGLYTGAFGPVVENGYGIGYSIQDERMGAIVSSYPEFCDAAGFIECLKSSYDDIKAVVDSVPLPPKK